MQPQTSSAVCANGEEATETVVDMQPSPPGNSVDEQQQRPNLEQGSGFLHSQVRSNDDTIPLLIKIIAMCFAAVPVALQALQTPDQVYRSSQFLCFRTVLGIFFLISLLGLCLSQSFKEIARILGFIAILLGATAFYLALFGR